MAITKMDNAQLLNLFSAEMATLIAKYGILETVIAIRKPDGTTSVARMTENNAPLTDELQVMLSSMQFIGTAYHPNSQGTKTEGIVMVVKNEKPNGQDTH
jgi:hypothetical protein